jgi:hypothetical protein
MLILSVFVSENAGQIAFFEENADQDVGRSAYGE